MIEPLIPGVPLSSPGFQLAALRRLSTHTCPQCGREFVARTTAIYCSAPCRMKAAYEARKKQK